METRVKSKATKGKIKDLVTKLTTSAPKNFKLEWKGDLLSPIRYKTVTTKETAKILSQIWTDVIRKVTNCPIVNLKKYTRINVPYDEDTVTITIHPTATIMFQGKSSYDWADVHIERVNKEVDTEIRERKSKLNLPNEADISTRSVDVYGVCAICDQANNDEMLECAHCFSWTHSSCEGLSEKEARKLKYYCKYCKFRYGLKSYFPEEEPPNNISPENETNKSKEQPQLETSTQPETGTQIDPSPETNTAINPSHENKTNNSTNSKEGQIQPETSTPVKYSIENQPVTSRNKSKENAYLSNLVFMQNNLSKMADDGDSFEESQKVNELKILAKSLSETMENALKETLDASSPNKSVRDKHANDQEITSTEKVERWSKFLENKELSDSYETFSDSEGESYEKEPQDQKSFDEEINLSSTLDSVSNIDPNEYNVENILKTVRKLQQEKFRNESEIKTLKEKLKLADEIIKIESSDGKLPENHRLHYAQKNEIIQEYMKLEDIVILINEKLTKATEQREELMIQGKNPPEEKTSEEKIASLNKSITVKTQLESEHSELKSQNEQLRSENEWLLKRTDEAKSEIVKLMKINQTQKNNHTLFEQQIENLQSINKQLNVMLILERESTEIIKNEDLVLKATNQKLVNAIKQLQNEKSYENQITSQQQIPSATRRISLTSTMDTLTSHPNSVNNIPKTMSQPQPTSNAQVSTQLPSTPSASINLNVNQPVLFDKTVPPPTYQNQSNVNREQDRQPVNNSNEGQNFYRPVCKDYVNGKCFSNRCIYYHPKKVSRSRMNIPVRNRIPSILDLNIANQSHQQQNEFPNSQRNLSIRDENVRYPSRNQSSQRTSNYSYQNSTMNRRRLDSGTALQSNGRFQTRSSQYSNSWQRHSSANENYQGHTQPSPEQYSNQAIFRSRLNHHSHQYQSDTPEPPFESSHPLTQYSERMPICKFYLRNNCRVGNFCRFSHQLPSSH